MRQGTASKNGELTLVSLGSNDGNPLATITAALDVLREKFSDLTESRLYQTEAYPAGSGPDFINGAVAFRTLLAPQDILAVLYGIEQDFGRTRTKRWGQRTLDLDLIGCGDAILPDQAIYDYWRTLPLEAQKTDAPNDLILPHPRVQDRLFVLVPLADVAPDWVHPHFGQTISDLIAPYPMTARAEIRPL